MPKTRAPRPLRLVLAAILLLAALCASGCSSLQPCPLPTTVAEIPRPDLDSVLFLIGDAGEAAPSGEPVLLDLRAALTAAVDDHGPAKVLVAFLGDNVYPSGLPSPESGDFAAARIKLDAQVDVFATFPEALARPLGIFVPGNHDWAHNAGDGLERVRRQQSRLAERGKGRVALLPGDGCPGPVAVDVGERLRLVALDTQWWYRTNVKPEGPSSGCSAGTEAAVVALLEKQLSEAAPRHTVVVGHHPFRSGGPHGGKTLFLRQLGLVPQDVPSPTSRSMIAALEGAFEARPPIVYAAGHEHSLQVLHRGRLPYLVVSGSGSVDNLTPVGALDDETLFCRAASGFVRLDFARDGRVRLAAIVADPARDGGREVFSTFLRTSPGNGPA